MTLKDEIVENPDGILENEDKLREIIADPDLTLKLLESKEEYSMKVKVDGVDVAMVRPTMPL